MSPSKFTLFPHPPPHRLSLPPLNPLPPSAPQRGGRGDRRPPAVVLAGGSAAVRGGGPGRRPLPTTFGFARYCCGVRWDGVVPSQICRVAEEKTCLFLPAEGFVHPVHGEAPSLCKGDLWIDDDLWEFGYQPVIRICNFTQ